MENSIILGLNAKDDFDPTEQPEMSDSHTERVYAPNSADIYGGFYKLFVYTNIIEHQVVGDYFVPQLRCVHISGVDKDIRYDKVHYLQVSKTHISDIDIELIKTTKCHSSMAKWLRSFILHLRDKDRDLVFKNDETV